MKNQDALLFASLDLDKAHGRAGHGLTDRLGIRSIILLPLHIGFYIARRHQSHPMPQTEFSSPMMGGRAGLHPDQASRLLWDDQGPDGSKPLPDENATTRGH